MQPLKANALHPSRSPPQIARDKAEADTEPQEPRVRCCLPQLQDQPLLLGKGQADVDEIGSGRSDGMLDRLICRGVGLKSEIRAKGPDYLDPREPRRKLLGRPSGSPGRASE